MPPTLKENLISILQKVEYAAIDIEDYDDESETLTHHAEQLYEAIEILKTVLQTVKRIHTELCQLDPS